MENWNKDNLCFGDTEEYQYSEAIDNIIDKIIEIKKTINKYDMQVYYDIKNNREKIKKTEQLKIINQILNMLKIEVDKL